MSDASNYVLNSRQLGGIESYVINDGEGRGVRALEVNTGGGLRYRVLVDRGLDIDFAFFREHSLTFLTHRGVTPPTRGLDRGTGWLTAFPGGLLTSCGPLNMGAPADIDGVHYGQHGTHSTTAANLDALTQPDVLRDRREMSIVGSMKHGALYGPCLDFRRTIRSTLGSNSIEISDEFYNAFNAPCPHAWLLHINFGYPLLAPGTRFCYQSRGITQREGDALSIERFADGGGTVYQEPSDTHANGVHVFSYLNPTPDASGNVTVGIVNESLQLGVAVRYSARQFPQCGNWQHFDKREYVAALEPMNGSVEGRGVDIARGIADEIPVGGTRRYDYTIDVLHGEGIRELLAMGPQ